MFKKVSRSLVTALLLAHQVVNGSIHAPETNRSSLVLLQGGTIVTYNTTTSSVEVLQNSSILIKDDRIKAIGTAFSLGNLTTVEIINVEGKILTPGFVDTHRHGWLTAFRTIASNTTLAEYFARYGEFSQASEYFTAEDVYIGQLTGIYEALNAGVTSILDHAHHTWSKDTSLAGLKASIDSGARVWWAYAVHQLENGFGIEEQFEDLEELAKDENGILRGSSVSAGLAYDRFFVAASDEVERALKLSRDLNLSVITTHFVGAPFGGDNSIKILYSYSALNYTIPVVFSHASALTQDEAVLLRKYNQFVSITPESEHHYGHDHPHSYHIQDQAALGIDTHATFSSDIVSQARLWLQATRLRLYRKVLEDWEVPPNSPMSVNQAFILATRNGGLALRRDDIGVIAPGAKADIVVFRGDSPNMIGWEDPVAAVILHSNVGDVEHVIVDGKFRKRDGNLVGVDWEGLVKGRFLPSAKRIQKIWKETKWPKLDGEFSQGTDYGLAETVDVLRGDGNGY